MTLNSGAHITHMSPATAQSRFYEPIYYDVNQETYLIDYNKVEELALKIYQDLLFVVLQHILEQ